MPNANQSPEELRGTYLNAKMFGAVADGVTDSWPNLQAAVNALKPGQELYIPTGRYLISNTLVVPAGTRITGKSGKRPDTADMSAEFGAQLLGSGITFMEISNPDGSYSGGDTLIDSLIFTDLTGDDDTIMIDVIGYLGGVEITDCVLRSPTLSGGVGIRGKGIGVRFTSVDNTFVNRTRIYGFNRGIVFRAASAVPCTSFSLNDCLIVGNNINIESPYEGGAVGIGNGLIKGGAIQFPWDSNISYKGNSLTLSGVHVENFKTQTVGGELRKAIGVQVLSGTLVTQGCDFYQPPQDETFHGNSSTRTWTLGYNCIATPLIYLNGTQDTSVGVDNVGHTATGYHYYWRPGTTDLRQDSGETLLTVSDDLQVVYPDEYCKSVDIGYAAAGNVVYNSISDQFVGCLASANPSPAVILHPRQATAYNPYLFIQESTNFVVHTVDGIGGPAAQDLTYNIEALETRHASRPGGEALISVQKKGDIGASNIRYLFSHRSNGQDFWLYSRDGETGGATFVNWLQCLYDDPTLHVPKFKIPQLVEIANQAVITGNVEMDAVLKVLSNEIYFRGTASNATQMEISKGAVASASNVQYFLSHRTNGTDLYLISYDGTNWINWLKLVPSSNVLESAKKIKGPDLQATNLASAALIGATSDGTLQAVGGGNDLIIYGANIGAVESIYSSIGAWLVERSQGVSGGYRVGVGLNMTFDGSNYKTGADGGSNAGSIILTNKGDGSIEFYTVPYSGTTQQTIDVVTLVGSNKRAVIDNSGNLTLYGLTASRPVLTDANRKLVSVKISPTNTDHMDVTGLTDGKPIKRSGNALATIALTASRIVKTDASSFLTTGKVDLGSSNDVDGTGLTIGDFLEWTGSAVSGYSTSEMVAALLTDLAVYFVDWTTYDSHIHSVDLPEHSHGGVTAGSNGTEVGGGGNVNTSVP